MSITNQDKIKKIVLSSALFIAVEYLLIVAFKLFIHYRPYEAISLKFNMIVLLMGLLGGIILYFLLRSTLKEYMFVWVIVWFMGTLFANLLFGALISEIMEKFYYHYPPRWLSEAGDNVSLGVFAAFLLNAVNWIIKEIRVKNTTN